MEKENNKQQVVECVSISAENENEPLIEDEMERSKVGIMRALCDRQDPSTKEVDDLMIRRFLRARDMDIEKASALFLKYLAWKKTVLPKGHIPESEIANDLSHNKVCMQGHDKKGRPILVIVGNRHNPSKGNPEEFKRQSTTPLSPSFYHQIYLLTYHHPNLIFFLIFFNVFEQVL
ncbi:hypothetical protein IGI04_039116 [Brassica rapa subsp. trilocularis]|uniref:CRAL/TRIO N-terminal domain-containing protein n=1 Tax=Brassica rapa subsp. trilocularis TaxID=1813537 RepID=A0ABQ7LM70_BRACM|nr:hypothetical protein IGI04_039116 [Brassica rapa subsp. trilocularis]